MRARAFRELMHSRAPAWQAREADSGSVTFQRRWATPAGAHVTHALGHVAEGPHGEHIAIWAEFEGLGLEFAIGVGVGTSAAEFRSLTDMASSVPDDLCRDSFRVWLEQMGQNTPIHLVEYEASADGGFTEVWKSPGSDGLAGLLSDDPFAHPVSLPFFDKDGCQVMAAPVPARARRVLSRAGWGTSAADLFVFGAGLDFRYDNGAAVFDAGWVNDELLLRVSMHRRPGGAAGPGAEFRMVLNDAGNDSGNDSGKEVSLHPGADIPLPVTDRFLRLLLGWQDRLRAAHQIPWFAAEIGAVAPGTRIGAIHGEPQQVLDTFATSPVDGRAPGPDRITGEMRRRAAMVVERLTQEGWCEARPYVSELTTAVAAAERVHPVTGERWHCAYVATAFPELPEGLHVYVAEPDGSESAIDGLVDVVGRGDPAAFGLPSGDERLALLLDRLAGSEPWWQVVGGLGLLGAFQAPTPGGLVPRWATSVSTTDLPRPSVRPLAEVLAAVDRTWWEVGFAAFDAGLRHLAAAAWDAARHEPGADTGLVDLWLGVLRYEADPAAASAALDRAARAGRMPGRARMLQAALHEREGDTAARLEALSRAASEESDDPATWSRYGLALAKYGRPHEAVAALTEALAQGGDGTVSWYRGYAHLLAGDRTAALADLAEAARSDAALAREIHADPDLAELRGEPRFEALAETTAGVRTATRQGVRSLLDSPGWREDAEGKLLREDDDFGGAVFTIGFSDEPDQATVVTLDIDDGVSMFLLFRVDLAERTEPFVGLLSRWPDEFGPDGDIEGWVDVGALVDALSAAYPGAVSFHQFGRGWVPVAADD